MSKKFMTAVLGTVSALALGHAYPAAAQAVDQATQPVASDSSGAGLEEVVVTARRREEKAQTVPIKMTVVNPEMLQDYSVQTAGDLANLVPGFNLFVNGQGQTTQQYIWIRGITGVTAYFAEVPTNFSGQALYFDMDNVQVLQGPQGTLFGLSSDSGAILFQPKKPTNSYEGYAQVTLGDYNRHDFDLVANIPVVADKLLVRVGGQYYHTDGWIKDVVQNKGMNDIDYWNGRVSVTLRPTDNIENYFMLNYFYTDTDGTVERTDDFNPVGTTAKLFPGSAAAYQTAIHQGYDVFYGVPGLVGSIAKQKQLNIADIATWDILDNLTIKNIAGYSEVTTLGRSNPTDLPFAIDYSLTPHESAPVAQYSDELQFQGKALDEKLTYVVGGFLLFNHSTGPVLSENVILNSTSGSLTTADERTQALYAQGTYDLGAFVDGLSFTAGYRYTWDYRAAWQQGLNSALNKVGAPLAADANFHAPNYTFSLDYQVSQGIMVYATMSKAYSSGGFNLSAPPQFRSYKPEYVRDYELGVKADWEIAGIKLRTNLDGFYSEYSNIQAQQNVTFQTAAGTQFAAYILNGATGHVEGLEFEGQINPIEGLSISGNASLVEPHYDHYLYAGAQPGFVQINGITDLSGTHFLIAPLLKYDINARYHLPVEASMGDISISANYAWQQHVAASISATPNNTLGSFATVDMTLDWKNIMESPFDGSLFVTNLFDNRWRTGEVGLYNSFGVWSIAVADPREFGVTLRYRFGPGLKSLF